MFPRARVLLFVHRVYRRESGALVSRHEGNESEEHTASDVHVRERLRAATICHYEPWLHQRSVPADYAESADLLPQT